MRVYYSVSNGGDGSAYPQFFETEKASDIHQSFEEEWGEDCTGHLDIEGDNIVVKGLTTNAEYLKELRERLGDCGEPDDKYYNAREVKKLQEAIAELE